MNSPFFFAMIILFYIFTLYLFSKQINSHRKIDFLSNVYEKFEISLNDDNDKIKINNLIKLIKGENISISNLRVEGNVNVIGKLNVNNESHFNGNRHHFYNNDKTNKIRVGAAYGLPGIYTDNDISLKSGSGNVYFLNYPHLEAGGILTINNEKRLYINS